jgi:hypothetical protein
LQGGGTTFWQAENGGFSGVGGCAGARARDTFCVTFFASEKRPSHRTVFDLKNRTVALTQHSPMFKKEEENIFFRRDKCVSHASDPKMDVGNVTDIRG